MTGDSREVRVTAAGEAGLAALGVTEMGAQV
jgi:hypothetical protein